MQADSLVQFCVSIGISASDLVDADTYDALKLSKQIEAQILQRITPDSIRSIVDAFGPILSMSISVPADDPMLEIKDGRVDNLDEALQELRQREPTAPLRFELSLDKEHIANRLGLDSTQYRILYFIFKDAFLNFLKNSTLLDLDSLLFKKSSALTVIVVSDASYLYKGDLLTITGFGLLDKIKSGLRLTGPEVKGRVDAYFKTASDNLSWLGFRLNNLTPEHFMCSCAEGEDATLTTVLENWLLQLCVIYTANRTSYIKDNSGATFRSIYASSDQETSLSLGFESKLTHDIESKLFRLAQWPYEGKSTDRLIILQNVIARDLWDDDPIKNFARLVAQLKHMLDEADRNYRIYTDGKIDKHFEATKSLVEYITDVTKDVSDAVDSVTKGLIESLLTTIGFIVATIITALVEGTAQSSIFAIGMKAYAGYVFLFQLIYRMGSIYHSYYLLQKECDERVSDYSDRLYLAQTDTLSALKAPLQARRKQFNRWFFGTVLIYLVVSIGLVWFSNPVHLIDLKLIGPLPTPTLTPTPFLTPMPTSVSPSVVPAGLALPFTLNSISTPALTPVQTSLTIASSVQFFSRSALWVQC